MVKVKEFALWIERGIKELGNGAAFCFNLYEDVNEWTCEFINTNSFDRDDEDWVCDEKNVYSRENPVLICSKKETGDFEEVLERFHSLLIECLEKSKAFKTLSKTKPIAYGFVDGDVEYIN